MRKLVSPLTGLALFVYGLIKIEGAIYTIIDKLDMTLGVLILILGALLLSIEISRW